MPPARILEITDDLIARAEALVVAKKPDADELRRVKAEVSRVLVKHLKVLGPSLEGQLQDLERALTAKAGR